MFPLLQFDTCKFLYFTQHRHFFARTKGNGTSLATRTSRPSDTMDISFRYIGQIVVENQIQTFDINTACRNIRSDNYIGTTFLEITQCTLAGIL